MGEARIRDKFRGRDKAKGTGRAGSEQVPAEGPVILWMKEMEKGPGRQGKWKQWSCSQNYLFLNFPF